MCLFFAYNRLDFTQFFYVVVDVKAYGWPGVLIPVVLVSKCMVLYSNKGSSAAAG